MDLSIKFSFVQTYFQVFICSKLFPSLHLFKPISQFSFIQTYFQVFICSNLFPSVHLFKPISKFSFARMQRDKTKYIQLTSASSVYVCRTGACFISFMVCISNQFFIVHISILELIIRTNSLSLSSFGLIHFFIRSTLFSKFPCVPIQHD